MKLTITTLVCAAVLAGPVLAQDVDPLIQQAIDSGICGDARVISAVLNDAGELSVDCEDDVAGFLPLVGGLGPVIAGGVVAVLAAAGGGGGASDTQ